MQENHDGDFDNDVGGAGAVELALLAFEDDLAMFLQEVKASFGHALYSIHRGLWVCMGISGMGDAIASGPIYAEGQLWIAPGARELPDAVPNILCSWLAPVGPMRVLCLDGALVVCPANKAWCCGAS